MAKRLLDYDPNTGVAEWHDYDEASDTTHIGYSEDVEPLLDRNKAARNETHGRRLGDGALVASIPITVQMKWFVEKGVKCWDKDHMPAVLKLLDDPDWRYLKCRDIILSHR